MTRRGAHLRKGSARSSFSSNITGHNSEVRTSTRSVRKVSYVESDESEEVDESKKKKPQKVQSPNFGSNFHAYVITCIFLLFFKIFSYQPITNSQTGLH